MVQNPPPSAGWPAAPRPVRGGKPGLPRRRPPLQPGRAPKDPPRPAAPFFSRSRVGQAGPSGGASGRVRAPARTTHPLPRQLEAYPSLPRGRGGWARRRDAGAGPGAKAPRGACRGKLGGCCSLCERAHASSLPGGSRHNAVPPHVRDWTPSPHSPILSSPKKKRPHTHRVPGDRALGRRPVGARLLGLIDGGLQRGLGVGPDDDARHGAAGGADAGHGGAGGGGAKGEHGGEGS